MTNKYLSQIVGASNLVKLAPDLTFPSTVNTSGYISVTGFNCTAGLTTVLSLTGRWAISLVELINMVSESNTYKLTIDGIVIMNDTFVSGTVQFIVGDKANASSDRIVVQCDESFLLEVQTATDTSIDLNYVARPIL